MGQEERLFKSEEPKSRAEVAAFLRDLAARLEQGSVVLRQGAQELAVAVPESAVLEIEVERKDKGPRGVRHSLEVEVSWYEGGTATGPVELG